MNRLVHVLLLCACSFAECLCAQLPQTGPDLNAIDRSANPCDDFYQYACGNWLVTHPIPATEAAWGRFSELQDKNQEILRDILETAEKDQESSEINRKIGGMYQSCMDTRLIEANGVQPLTPERQRIEQISDRKHLLAEIARLQELGVDVFFHFGPETDPEHASMQIAEIAQAGLGLPEKDYYLRTDPHSVEIRDKYLAHIAKMLELIGTPREDAVKQAQAVMAIETKIAGYSLSRVQVRDPKSTTHLISRKGLAAMTTSFDILALLDDEQPPAFARVNVAEPAFVEGVSTVFANASLTDLKSYLLWHYLHASADVLASRVYNEHFDFYWHTLYGFKEQRPLWKRCVDTVDVELGEALGRKFVEKTFGEEGKQRALEMVEAIEGQMAKEIAAQTWMSPATKNQALVKLRGVTKKIGYPERWRDYSTVEIVPADFFGNVYRAREFEMKRQLNKIGTRTDKGEWKLDMTPPTVNAYYDASENNVNFPAGVLQAPLYSSASADAANYGAVGSVIGHELTHGFDDKGRQYDADGNLRNWWQPDDDERFIQLAECFVNEYNGFSPLPELHVDGRLTLGENTADNGGVRLSYSALMANTKQKGVPDPETADGYSEAQQFFLAFGQIWCENIRPETVRVRLQKDFHAPAPDRVNGVVQNMHEFSDAFGCKPEDKLYVVKSCRVW